MSFKPWITLVSVAGLLSTVALTWAGNATDHSGTTSKGSAQASASAGASATFDADAARKQLEHQATRVSATARSKAETRIDAEVAAIDAKTASEGEALIADRLTHEFGASSEVLMEIKSQSGGSWGGVTVATTLAASSKSGLTATQILTLQAQGMEWAQIAAGLRLELNSVVSGVQMESRVARGLARADGKVAAMRGSGARVGAGANGSIELGATKGITTSAGAGLGTAVHVGH